MTVRPYAIAVAVTTALLTAACGGSPDSESGSAPTNSSTVNPSEDMQRPPDRLSIDISIEGGNVTPTNAQLQGKVNEPIVMRVNSDAADELHVHSVPEHTFQVEPLDGQQFEFTVDVPGNVEIELHDLNRVVATVQVQP